LGDALLAGVFVAATVAESLFSDTTRPPLVHAAVTVPAMALLAWRRRIPLVAAATLMAATALTNPEGQFSTVLALVLVSFSCGAELDSPRSWVGLAILTVPFLAGMTLEGLEPSDVAAGMVFLVGPWTVGVTLRQRSARAAEAVDRAARLERERETQTAAAAAEERARIARELHDIVSHSISVVAIQVQAVRRRLHHDQEREVQDLAAVETTARQALAEMRRLFGMLRAESESPSLAPQPGLAQLDRQTRGAYLVQETVELRVDGDRIALPPGADLAAYRIVQEGLTNALRHAQASYAVVRLSYGATTLDVVVEDDGCGPTDMADGHGLVGIRERVALYGGSVTAGPRPAGGFRLAVTLRIRE
jgi:signal transduction histidine kinase